MAGMDDYLNGSSYTGDSSEGGGQHMSLDDGGEGFYGRVTGNQDKKFGDHDATKAAKQKEAAEGLKGGEKSALGGNGSKITGDGTDGARQGENNITSGFKNSVTGESDSKSKRGLTGKKKDKSVKGRMKRILPALIAVGGVGGFGIASFFGQLAMPYSLVSQFQGNFDSIGTSNYVRSRNLMRWAMHPGTRAKFSPGVQDFIKTHGKIYQKLTGSESTYFKISDKQIARFKKKGIRVKNGGPAGQYLEIDNPDGGVTKVVADPKSAGEYGGDTYKSLDEVYEQDENFRKAYFEGTKTWRQAIKAWFDGLCTKFLNRLGIKRANFKGFKAQNDTDATKATFEGDVEQGIGKDDYKGAAANGTLGTGEKEVKDKDGNPVLGDDGKPKMEPDNSPDGVVHSPGNGGSFDDTGQSPWSLKMSKAAKYNEIAEKMDAYANTIASKYNRMVAVANVAAKLYCFVMEVINCITLLVMANEASEVMKTASTIMSGVQQAQVEDSSTSPINNIANSLTRKKTTKYYKDSNGSDEPEQEEVYGSAMEAEAITATYGNTWIDVRDQSVKSFKLTEETKHTLFGINVSFLMSEKTQMVAYKACIGSKMVLALANMVGDIAQILKWGAKILSCIAGAIAQAYASCVDLLVSLAWTVIKMVALQTMMQTAINFVKEQFAPRVATMVQRKFFEDIGGQDYGNAMVSGANIYMGKNHQQGGGAAATKGYLVTYLKEREEYIADVARHERETKSPFDATSPYTFMGNLLSRSVPILVGNNTIFEGIKNVASVTSNAIRSLIPGASAVTAAVTAQTAADETLNNCPDLASIEAVGDVFCNPYYITDFNTVDEDPAEVVYKVSQLGNNFTKDEGDIPTINTTVNNTDETSRLMEYILYCGQRDSPLGMVNMNIGNAISSGDGGSWTDYIPIWGGFVDFFRNDAILHKIGYVTGASCVMRDGDPTELAKELGDETFTWEEAKYYQRFIEDQRYLESAGLVEKNSVSIALDEYYEKNPLDESYEGLMARMTGMTKEQVIATEDAVDVLMWLANYTPDGYYPYGYTEPEPDQISLEDEEDYVDLEQYNNVDDYSWKYMLRMEYDIV